MIYLNTDYAQYKALGHTNHGGICYMEEDRKDREGWYIIHIMNKFIEDEYVLNPYEADFTNVEAAKEFVTDLFLEIFPIARERE